MKESSVQPTAPWVVTGYDVWPALLEVAKAAGPRFAAIAFIGRDAKNRLHLKCGDVLVCNASRRALAMGATNPSALREMVEAGVEVYSLDRLHAKVFVGRASAFIGSANASPTSEASLEAATILRTAKARDEVRAFVEEARTNADLVDQAFLEQAEQWYRAPRGGLPGVTSVGADAVLIRERATRMWLTEWREEEATASEIEALDRGRRRVRRQAGSACRFRVEHFFESDPDDPWPDVGDLVIRLTRNGTHWIASPPEVVLTKPEKVSRQRSWVWFSCSDLDLRAQALRTGASWTTPRGRDGNEDKRYLVEDQRAMAQILSKWGLNNPSA